MTALEPLFEIDVQGNSLFVDRNSLLLLHALRNAYRNAYTANKNQGSDQLSFHVAKVRQELEALSGGSKACKTEEEAVEANAQIIDRLLKIDSENYLVNESDDNGDLLCNDCIATIELPSILDKSDWFENQRLVPTLIDVEKFTPAKNDDHLVALLALVVVAIDKRTETGLTLADFIESLKEDDTFVRFIEGKEGTGLAMCVGRWVTVLTRFSEPLVEYKCTVIESVTEAGMRVLQLGRIPNQNKRLQTRKTKSSGGKKRADQSGEITNTLKQISAHQNEIRRLKQEIADRLKVKLQELEDEAVEAEKVAHKARKRCDHLKLAIDSVKNTSVTELSALLDQQY
jgi:hypothetical protein